MPSIIHVDEEALRTLKGALQEQGENYKKNLRRLQALVEEITSGDIQGDPATDLMQKYEEKKETFQKIADTIDEAEGYMGMRTTGFTDMVGEMKNEFK